MYIFRNTSLILLFSYSLIAYTLEQRGLLERDLFKPNPLDTRTQKEGDPEHRRCCSRRRPCMCCP